MHYGIELISSRADVLEVCCECAAEYLSLDFKLNASSLGLVRAIKSIKLH